MASSNAERQRRYRRHKAGDHTLCDPSRCSGVVASPVTSAVTSRVESLGPRGQRLWLDEDGDSLRGGRRELLVEACRLADRLDRLNAVLSGDRDAVVTLDKLLAEARQQAIALKQILVEHRQGAAKKPESGGSVIDQLAARREARRSNTAG